MVETNTLSQLPRLAGVSPDALTLAEEPGASAGAIPIKRLLGRLISTEEATATLVELAALLGYDANAIALVFADPQPSKNGWYRKEGAKGTGSWIQFEQLSSTVAAQLQPLVEAAQEAAADAAKSVSELAPLTTETQLRDDGAMPYAFLDALGRVLAGISPDGSWITGGLTVEQCTVSQNIDGPAFLISAQDGSALMAVREDGSVYLPGLDTADRANLRTITLGPSGSVQRVGMNHVLMTGQSLSVAGNNLYPSAGCDRTDVVLSAGIAAGVGSPNTGLNPMPVMYDCQVLWEACAQLKFLIQFDSQFAHDYRILASGHGRTGHRLDQIAKGTPAYLDGMWQVSEAARQSDLLGVLHQVQALCYVQGEADRETPVDQWKAGLVQLLADYRRDIQGLIGQQWPFPLLSYQCASEQREYAAGVEYEPHTARGIQELVSERSDILCFAPTYHLNYSDGTHLIGDDYQHLGQHLGRVLYETVYRGGTWTGLRPREVIGYRPDVIIARFHVPVAPLVFRTDRVSDPGDRGFQVRDANGIVPIASVDIIADDTVRIKTSRARAANPTLAYAWYSTGGTPAGRLTGPRGCLFDSDPTVAHDRDAPFKLANPCIRFKLPVI